MVKESEFERNVCRTLRDAGWLVIKVTPVGDAGYPDRMAIHPTGIVYWLELKTDTGKVGKLQAYRHEILRNYNQQVAVLRPSNFDKWYGQFN